jgi:4-hydroxybenzoate polyprenyltransferase
MLVFMAVSLALFLTAVYNLSEWSRYLWPAAVAPMVLYPYLKRFTWGCHLGISLVYLIVPPAVWIAVTNEFTLGAVLLGLGAGTWVAGFDIIYAIQDMSSDRRNKVHSIPADFGLAWGLFAAKGFHLAAVGFLLAAGTYLGAGALYYLGVTAFLFLLVYEHRLVSPHDTSKVNVAFFNMNGIISVVFALFVIGDVLAS